MKKTNQSCAQVISELHAYVNKPRFHNMVGCSSCETMGINISLKQQAVLRPFHKHERF